MATLSVSRNGGPGVAPVPARRGAVRLGLAVSSGLVLALAFPPLDLEFLGWIGLVPLLLGRPPPVQPGGVGRARRARTPPAAAGAGAGALDARRDRAAARGPQPRRRARGSRRGTRPGRARAGQRRAGPKVGPGLPGRDGRALSAADARHDLGAPRPDRMAGDGDAVLFPGSGPAPPGNARPRGGEPGEPPLRQPGLPAKPSRRPPGA